MPRKYRPAVGAGALLRVRRRVENLHTPLLDWLNDNRIERQHPQTRTNPEVLATLADVDQRIQTYQGTLQELWEYITELLHAYRNENAAGVAQDPNGADDC